MKGSHLAPSWLALARQRPTAMVASLLALGLSVVVVSGANTSRAGSAGATSLSPRAIVDGSILSMSTSQPQTRPPALSKPIAGQSSGNIRISSFQWGAMNSLTNCAGTACRGRTGTAVMSPLKVSRQIDQISPVFLNDCVTGVLIKTVTLYVSPPPYGFAPNFGDSMKIEFTNVRVTSDQFSASGGATEEFTMIYQKYKVTYSAVAPLTPTTTSTSTTTTSTTTTTAPPPPPVIPPPTTTLPQ